MSVSYESSGSLKRAHVYVQGHVHTYLWLLDSLVMYNKVLTEEQIGRWENKD